MAVSICLDKLATSRKTQRRILILVFYNAKKAYLKYVSLKLYHIENSQTVGSVDQDEVAHNEPPHLTLYCLQTQLFSILVLFGLRVNENRNTQIICDFFVTVFTSNYTLYT